MAKINLTSWKRGNLGFLGICLCVLSSLQFSPIANFRVTQKATPQFTWTNFSSCAIQFVSPYISGPNCCNYHLAFWLANRSANEASGPPLNALNHRGQNALAYATQFKATRTQMQFVCVCSCTSPSAAPSQCYLENAVKGENQKEHREQNMSDMHRD